MRAAVWNGRGRLDVQERPQPELKPGWVRIIPAAVGICGTDLHFFRGDFPSPAGLIPGHEIGGVVEAVGEGVELGLGTPVAVEPLVGCGPCPSCSAGQVNRCSQRRLFGVNARGGMAERMVVPRACVYPLPSGVSAEDGALAEPVAVCVRGVRRAGVAQGSRVLVLGAGTIGLVSVVAARAAGAARVVVTGRHALQRERALALGADAAFASAEEAAAELGPDSIDCAIETVGGRASTLSDAVRLVRPGATVAMLGVFTGDAALPGLEFSRKELRLVGSNCYGREREGADFALALGLLAAQRERLSALVTHRLPLAQVNRAFELAADKASGALKVQVDPSA